jgi:hypothetical protein
MSCAKMHGQLLTSDPGDEIAIFERRKLVSPMILPTCRWKATGKLCKRSHNGGIACPAEKETIDKTCGATVLQSDVEDSKKAFPCHLC